VFEFFQGLFDTSGFPARWYCGQGWTGPLGWLHILSDLATWGAYTAIPIVLAYFVLRRKDAPFPKIFLLFACFIFACGTVHLIEATIFWWPIYRFSGAVKLATALVSWATVAALIPVTPKALALPGLAKINAQLQHEARERQAAEHALRESEAWLRAVVDSAGEGILTVDESGRIATFNPAAERIFDCEAEAAIGSKVVDFVPRFQELTGLCQDSGLAIDARSSVRQEFRGVRADGGDFPLELTVGETRVKGRTVRICVVRDITDRKRLEDQQGLLMAELSHRVKNTLATVQSIAMQTVRFSDSLAEFQPSFEGRLQALAQAHNLLTAGKWEAIGLRDIVERELQPHAGNGMARVIVNGPNLALRPKASVAIHMALHELATNAAKYGALSTESGQVEIWWELSNTSLPAELRLHWRESGGPPVKPPRRQGFGTQLIKTAVEYELDGVADVQYHPDGVRGELRIPSADCVGKLHGSLEC